jgi:hypothetical protein
LTSTRLDIANAVGNVTRFKEDPKEVHLAVVKIIFRYLKGTSDYGFSYDISHGFTLFAYTNVDWEGNVDDRKSTCGGTFFLEGKLVSWVRKKQNCISHSTT